MTGSKSSRNGITTNTSSSSVRAPTKNIKGNKPHLESIRSNSVPVMENVIVQNTIKEKTTELDLSIDPLTGVCLGSRVETAKLANIKEDTDISEESSSCKVDKDDCKGSYTDNLLSPSNCRSSTSNIHLRKLSSDEDSSSPSSRRSSRSSRRKSSHLADIQEQYIPDEKILEVRIDPMTGDVETSEVCRSKSSPTPNSPNITNFQERSMPFTSAKVKECENNNTEAQEYDIEKRRKLSVEVAKAPCSTKTTGDQHDDGIGSLPITPIDKFVERPPRLSIPPNTDDKMEFPALDNTFDKFGAYPRDQRETSAGNSSGSVGGINQYQTDGGYGADSICSWDEASSVAPDDDDDSRPVSTQPSNASNSSQTIVLATSNGDLSSISTSSSTSAQSNSNNNITNQVNRTCSGAFSRAVERLNANQPISTPVNTAQSPSNFDDTSVNSSMEDKESDDDDNEKSGSSDSCNNSVMRRQSSPMVRPSSS